MVFNATFINFSAISWQLKWETLLDTYLYFDPKILFFCHFCTGKQTGKKGRYFVYSTGLIATEWFQTLAQLLLTYWRYVQCQGVLHTTLCDKVCQWLATDRWFTLVSSTNKTDFHDITEILLKVALSTIKPNQTKLWLAEMMTILTFPFFNTFSRRYLYHVISSFLNFQCRSFWSFVQCCHTY